MVAVTGVGERTSWNNTKLEQHRSGSEQSVGISPSSSCTHDNNRRVNGAGGVHGGDDEGNEGCGEEALHREK